MKARLVKRSGDGVFRISPDMTGLPKEAGSRLLDLLTIANGTFAIEEALLEGHKVSQVEFPCYSEYGHRLTDTLEAVYFFMFHKPVQVVFVRNQQMFLTNVAEYGLGDGYTCLFSGGLDSFSGLLNSASRLGSVSGFFVNHFDQPALKRLVMKLALSPLAGAGVSVTTMRAARHRRETRLSRGLLYLLDAVSMRNKSIIVSEVGPTMFQPRFTVLDDVSVTTHPKIMEFAKTIASEVMEEEVRFIKPYEDLTKAEVAAITPHPLFVPKTMSCTTSMFASSGRPNCGSCYSCVVRRLATLVAGIDDCKYRTRWVIEGQGGSMDGVIQLIRFSIDYLENPDGLPWYSTGLLRRYKKEVLFERFALDNLAGLHILSSQGGLNATLERLHRLAMRTVTKEATEERIGFVRERGFRPDFGNIL